MTEWAVVAGASGALGRGIVARLSERGLGIVAVGRTEASLAEVAASVADARVCVADITTDEGQEAVAAAVPGPVRMVVNSAAAPMGGGILEVPPETLVRAVDVKVNGTLRLVRATHDALTEDARIVAIGGNLGYDPIPEAATAGVGNAALANAMRQLSRALGSRGVTVNVVAPGPVWTERLRTLLRDAAAERGVDEQVVVEEFEDRSPIGHLTTIDEVAWAVALLADPEARAIAGNTLILDAGQRTFLL
ncbi:MAG: SDR family oxidoreductase [Acidimicrobiia bacterium]|nr:SDR family oxidoreductase [Acidimicrobiia bacterium]